VVAVVGRPVLPAGASPEDPAALSEARGAFTLVVAETRGKPSVRITRDHLGSLPVCFHLNDTLLVAAGEPAVLLRLDLPGLPGLGEPDEGSVARFLGFRFGLDGRTFFRDVERLPPAHHLTVAPGSASVERYWRFPAVAELDAHARDPDALGDELRRRLAAAVTDEIGERPPPEVAVSLSGGLDSTAVAAVAPSGVRAVSWRFRDAAMDERERVEAVARHLGMPVTWVDGDGCGPLGPGFGAFVHAGSPYVNPFASLKARLYEAARDAGCEQVLVGDGGDALYAAREYWLRDLLADRQSGALSSFARTLREAARGDRFARLSLRRLLPRSPLRGGRDHRPAWLTPAAHALLPPPAPSPIVPRARGRRESIRLELTVGSKHTRLEAEEQRLFRQCGVARGNPFWSWPLLAWASRLPAYALHRDGRDKLLTRAAFRDRLPAEVLTGPRGGLLGPLFLDGLGTHRDRLRELLLTRPSSDWQRYVHRDWLEPHLDRTDRIAFGHTILWRVICYELWMRRLAGDPGDVWEEW
jgi:asparagine synthase (glutamine-hydrolysing)